MANDPLRAPDAEYRNWVSRFNSSIAVMPGALGLTPELCAEFNANFLAFDSAFAEATDPATRTSGKIASKNHLRRILTDNARNLMKIIDATPSVTQEMRLDLGLRPTTSRTPAPVPTEAPVVNILEMNGWEMKGQVKEPGSKRRGLPSHVRAINIFSFVGAAAPINPKSWVFNRDCSTSIFSVQFDSELPIGTRVWICVAYKNRRCQSGPACAPIGLVIGGGVPETLVA